MPKLIMLVGGPGTGKSTWIRQFKARNPEEDWVIVSSDDILDELGAIDGISYQDAFSKYASFANKEMFRRAEKAIQSGSNVIWDQTNLNRKSRKKKLGMFPDSYEKEAVVFVVSEAEIKRRLKKREEEVGKHIPPHVVKNMAASYQPPSKEEGFSKIKYERS